MKKYGKYIAVVVVALIVIALVIGLGSKGSGNLVKNGNFEAGVMTPWVDNGGGAEVVDSNSRGSGVSGSYCLYVGPANGGGEQTITGLSPNTAYVLTGWVRTDTDSVDAQIGVKDYGGDEAYQTTTSAAYTQLTVNFTTGASNTTATIYCYKVGEGDGLAYCDDFVLQKQ